jgi:hypothetical protein
VLIQASSTDINKIIRSDYGTDDFWMQLADTAIDRWRDWNANLFPRYRSTITAYDGTTCTDLYQEVGVLLLKHRQMQVGDFEYESFRRIKQLVWCGGLVYIDTACSSSIAIGRLID